MNLSKKAETKPSFIIKIVPATITANQKRTKVQASIDNTIVRHWYVVRPADQIEPIAVTVKAVY